jgi:hypothetical protein
VGIGREKTIELIDGLFIALAARLYEDFQQRRGGTDPAIPTGFNGLEDPGGKDPVLRVGLNEIDQDV